METFVDIISDIGAQISKIKRCRVNQQTLINFDENITNIRIITTTIFRNNPKKYNQ